MWNFLITLTLILKISLNSSIDFEKNILSKGVTYDSLYFVGIDVYNQINFIEDGWEGCLGNIITAKCQYNAPKDSIIFWIDKLLETSPIYGCERLLFNEDFNHKTLLKNSLGLKYVSGLEKKCKCLYNNQDSVLKILFTKIIKDDQWFRGNDKITDFSNPIYKEQWKQQTNKDVFNLKIITKIIDSLGFYPGRDLVGIDLQDVAFIVLQHSNDTLVLKKYLPLIENAVKKYDLDRFNLPLIVDRLLMLQKLPQIYGTQTVKENYSKGKYQIYHLKYDIETTNKLRKKYSHGTLEEYCRVNNVLLK